jgi:hypothetical protein
MLIGASEGKSFRFEVLEAANGFLVRMRDLDTGAVEEKESKIFRTAAVAFAYAEMSAAFERFAQAKIAGEESAELEAELDETQLLYGEISHRLGDSGIAAHLIVAWDRQHSASDRRRYH